MEEDAVLWWMRPKGSFDKPAEKKSAQVSVSSARAFNAAEIEKCFYDVFLYKYRGLIYNKIVAINEQIYNFA